MYLPVRQLRSLSLILIFCWGAVYSSAQSRNPDYKSKAISRKSLTPKKLDDIVSDHVSDVVTATAKTKPTTADLVVLKAIYEAAFRIKTQRQVFIKTVDDYQHLVSANASYLDREQAYYAMGNAAADELRAVKDFDGAWDVRAAQLNLRYKTIDFEVTQWQSQQHDVIEPILNKPKFFGMSKADLDELKRQLDEHGRHLDTALDSLRNALVASEADVTATPAKPLQ